MPSGLQFSNLNRYRRYPFADDSDLSATVLPYGSGERRLSVPESFFRMFRAVVVHAGAGEAKEVRLTGFGNFSGSGESLDDPISIGNYWVSFRIFGDGGAEMPFSAKGKDFSPDLVVRGVSQDGVTAAQFADFDFSHCVSLCFETGFSDLPPEFDGAFSCSCDVKMSPGTLLSLEAPHVMSLMDDSGNAVRGAGEVELVAGHNVKFDVMEGTNTVIVTPLRGAGAGLPAGKAGLSSAFAQLDLRTLNGVSADKSGNVALVGGNGLDVETVPGTNIVNVYSATETPSAIGCEAK